MDYFTHTLTEIDYEDIPSRLWVGDRNLAGAVIEEAISRLPERFTVSDFGKELMGRACVGHIIATDYADIILRRLLRRKRVVNTEDHWSFT